MRPISLCGRFMVGFVLLDEFFGCPGRLRLYCRCPIEPGEADGELRMRFGSAVEGASLYSSTASGGELLGGHSCVPCPFEFVVESRVIVNAVPRSAARGGRRVGVFAARCAVLARA